MSFVLLCSGQGHQHPGMFDMLQDRVEAKAVLEEATSVLGSDVRAWHKGPDDLFSNVRAQPLICVAQLAAWRSLRKELPMPAIVAGYSVGELASYACADAVDTSDLCRLARSRAQAMEDAARLRPGTLVAIEGLARAEIDRLCDGRDVWVAIIVEDKLCIVGGSGRAVDELSLDARGRGARVQSVRVRLAAHTPLLSAAVEPFRNALLASRLVSPAVPAIAGVDASLVTRRDDAIRLLCRQIAETVDWSRCMQTLYERGCRVFLELGPGAALARMIHRRFPDAHSRSIDDFRSLDAVTQWLKPRIA